MNDLKWYNISYITEKYKISMFCNRKAKNKQHAINIIRKEMKYMGIDIHVTEVEVMIDMEYVKCEE